MTAARTILLMGAIAAVAAVWLWLAPPRWWLNLTKSVDLSDPVATGAVLVRDYDCQRCHMVGGAGMARGPNLAGVTRRHDAEALKRWLADPKAVRPGTSMPDFRLADSEIEAIVAYLAALDASES